MLKRNPDWPKYIPPGPKNPLGTHALAARDLVGAACGLPRSAATAAGGLAARRCHLARKWLSRGSKHPRIRTCSPGSTRIRAGQVPDHSLSLRRAESDGNSGPEDRRSARDARRVQVDPDLLPRNSRL